MPNDADRAGTPAGVFGAELRFYRTRAVLHRAIGGSKVMRSQLYRLAEVAEHGSAIPCGLRGHRRLFSADRVEQQHRGHRRPVDADRVGHGGRSCAGLGGQGRPERG